MKERIGRFMASLKARGGKGGGAAAGGEGKAAGGKAKGRVPPQAAIGLALVAVVALGWSFMGGGERNPYADLKPAAGGAGARPEAAGGAPVGGEGPSGAPIPAFSVGGARAAGKKASAAAGGGDVGKGGGAHPVSPPPGGGVRAAASGGAASGQARASGEARVRRELARLREQVRRMRESGGKPRGGDVDALVANVDRLVAEMIEHMDLSRVHGDVFRGTTAETEALRRLERIMDAVIRLQKKRAELLAVSRQVRLVQRSPEQVVRVEVAPLRQKVEQLSAQLSRMRDRMEALQASVREQEKRRGVAVVGPAASQAAGVSRPQRDEDFPSLVGVTVRDGRVVANLRWKGRYFAVDAPGLEVGPWRVEDVREDEVVVRSGDTGRLYGITMGGPVEVKEEDGHAS